MRITKDMTIAGVPAVRLRDTFQQWDDSNWDMERLSGALRVSPDEAGRIRDNLVDEGLIGVAFEHDGKTYYRTTTKGLALSNASAAKPIARKTADRLLREVIGRAAHVNATPDFVHHVVKVSVFGSYLSDRPDLGDVDIAVELSRKLEGQAFIDACLAYADRQTAEGRRLSSFTARLFCAEQDIYKTLRGSSRAVSIHQASELPELGVTGSQIIYEYP